MDADMKHAKDTRTEAQKESLLLLLKTLKKLHPEAVIYGHRDFSSKACPSFDAKTEYADI
jgi:N-acetylmuramoyl-L-alanine amidase